MKTAVASLPPTPSRWETWAEALLTAPQDAELRLAFSREALSMHAYGPAVRCLTICVNRYPKHAGFRQELLRFLMLAGRAHDALPHFKALAGMEGARDLSFYLNYTYALQASGLYAEAEILGSKALAAYPSSAELYALRGGVRQALGLHKDAIEDYAEAVALQPENPNFCYTLSLARMMNEGIVSHIDAYETRFAVSHAPSLPSMNVPRWDGSLTKGLKLLLLNEQGVGDVIMFASVLPHLRAAGMQLTLQVPAKMRSLFARSFPDIACCSEQPSHQIFDAYAPFGDVMRALSSYTPKQHPPYLKADRAYVDSLRARYQHLAPGKKLVGIAWHTVNPHSSALRSIKLAEWAPLFQAPPLQCVSLQYGAHAPETAAIDQAFPGALMVDSEVDGLQDMDGLAAQIAAMDQVVTIQNATAHLAGALGVPTLLLLSTASDWRWGMQSHENPWYASVRVLRQAEPLVWQPLLQQIADEITR